MSKDKKLLKKWVEALRSGRYKQGKGALCYNKDKYCCLGVLCEVAGLRYKKNTSGYKSYVFRIYKNLNLSSENSIPNGHPLAKLLGKEQDLLIEMNDRDDFTFNEIANWIEDILIDRH